ncbi:Retrotransposon-derived protein PEG10 [Ceratobasidium sp. AG-Ba]|nr:Retrotransposon-derived protein PEG10 [Ceratobasidium sp. AG-Ba]
MSNHRSASAAGSARNSPLLGSMPLPATSSAGATDTAGAFLYGPEDRTRLGCLYTYLIGASANVTTPPAFHGALERLQGNLVAEVQASKARILAAVAQMFQNSAQSAQQRIQTTPTRTTAPADEETPKPTLATGSAYQDYWVPTRFGSEDPSASNQPKQEPASEDNDRRHLARPSSPSEHSVMEFDPYGTSTPAARGRVAFESVAATQTQAATSSATAAAPTTGSNTPVPNSYAPEAIPIGMEGLRWTPAPAQETKAQEELRTMSNIASVLQHALSRPLEQTVRAATQTPGPTNPKSKIPAPEKFSGKEGNAAKSFMLDCKTYFVANTSSFPTDEARMMYVLMNLKEGTPKQWGKYYLNKLLAGDQDPLLDSWQAFESGFLANWSDHAALQVAERRINELKQTASASDYATEFRVSAGELEWSDSALMAAFCRRLKPFVRSKLIEHTIGHTISSLDELINVASLIDNTLFEVRKEAQTMSQNSPSSSSKPATRKSAGFVTVDIREKRRKAGQCPKCGDASHKFEQCTNGWKLKPDEHSKSIPGKIGSLIDLTCVEMSPGNLHGGYPGHSLPASLPSCIPRRGREEE